MPDDGADDLDPVWRALASPIRRRILDLLRDGPKSTGEIANEFPDLSRFAIMQHLLVLENGGLTMPRRQGRQKFHYLNPIPIQRIHDRWVSRYQQPWAEALVSLKAELEDEAAEGA